MKQKQSKIDEDANVIRQMKSILNKLTVEKFDTLYQKLLECGIETHAHIECLMREVFEKATTQHHFIEMYTTLCVKLSEWYERDLVRNKNQGDGDEESFKRILLNQCQDSFELYLKPPAGLQELAGEERFQAIVKYKTKMLGNMKFVAQLLINKMLSSKIIFQCVEELLQVSSEEALETLCAFLCAVGPAFDVEGWKGRMHFVATFARVKEVCNDPKTPQRIKCLLKDVLDYRASGWERKNRAYNDAGDGPKRMGEVRAQWVKDNADQDRRGAGGGAPPTPSKGGHDDQWETVPRRGGERGGERGSVGGAGGGGSSQISRTTSSQLPGRDRDHGNFGSDRAQRPARKPKESGWHRSGTAPELRSGSSNNATPSTTPLPTPSGGKSLLERTAEVTCLGPSTSTLRSVASAAVSATAAAASAADAAASERRAEDSRREFLGAITELAASHDLDGAVMRVREAAPKRGQEVALVEKVLPKCAEQAPSARPCLWKFLGRLVKEELFQRDGLAEGVEKFLSSNNYAELYIDLPMLPTIFREELFPALQSEAGFSAQQVAKLAELEAAATAAACKDDEEDNAGDI
jgi:hypothetical protein